MEGVEGEGGGGRAGLDAVKKIKFSLNVFDYATTIYPVAPIPPPKLPLFRSPVYDVFCFFFLCSLHLLMWFCTAPHAPYFRTVGRYTRCTDHRGVTFKLAPHRCVDAGCP